MPNTYTTQDGKTARLVNPYTYPAAPKLHIDFESNNPPIPLTAERPDLIGKEFTGEVVWMAKKPLVKKWYEIEEDEKDYLSEFGCSFRQAIKPLSLPVKGEEHYDENGDLNVGVIGQQFEKAIDNMPDYGFRFKQDEVWNSAIDAAVKKLHVGMFASDMNYDDAINQLNSLRK